MEIHRCRFVPYQPSSINALAFSHHKPRSAIHNSVARLAVGRANGDVELWNPSAGKWHQELVIRGGKDRSIDGLVWVNEPDQDLGGGRFVVGKSRLFSIGYTSTITEWDLEMGKPKRHASGQHGDIWCLAAQPPASALDPGLASQASTMLLAGTVHGDLAIYSVEDEDLRFERLLVKAPTTKAQMVSITFQSRRVAVVGCSDSTIRVYDVARGYMLRRMTLGSDLVGGAKHIIVWSVKCLPNGNIVSGDSTGQICIWDGKTYTQSQRIESHKQDVLSLAVSVDGTSIMSGGMDRRTFLYKQNAGPSQRWSKVWGRRYHDHDVKAMASFEHGRMSVVVSGGPDANLMVLPLREMERENHRTVSYLPQQPPIASASNARFMVSWWDRQVHIWVLKKPTTELLNLVGDDGVDINHNRKLLKSIIVRGDSNITSASVDDNGSLLVVSTAIDVKAFHLRHQNPAKPSDVSVTSLELPRKVSRLGASHVKLSPNGEWLCLVQEGSRVLMAGIRCGDTWQDPPSVLDRCQRLSRLHRDIPRYILNGGLGSYDRNITQVAFSADSLMLAVADLAGYMDVWNLCASGDRGREENDSVDGDYAASSDSGDSCLEEGADGGGSERWTRNAAADQMPKLPSVPALLSFSGHVPADERAGADDANTADDYVLVAITSSWRVLAFHPRRGSLTTWSRRHPPSTMPAAIQDLVDLPKGILWQGSRMWVYGVSFLLMLDMSEDLPKPVPALDESRVAHGTKRKRTGPTTGAGGIKVRENLAPHKVRRHGVGEQYEDMDVGGHASDGDGSDNDEELPDADGELSRLRLAGSGDVLATGSGSERKSWWLTYKYRPILGIVPLSKTDDCQSLEVALVERPAWDREMPERYYAGDEWER